MLSWLGISCGSLVGLFVLWIVVAVVRLVLRYRRSPERRWCDHVLKLMDTAHRRAQAEREAMKAAGVQHADEDRAMRDQAFHAFLGTLPVSELDAYPGIGPATVGKLRDAGYADLAALYDAPLEGMGLGQKRLADVQYAVRNLVEQAHSRFDAGACGEAQDLAIQLELLRASRSEQGMRATERYLAAVNVMQKLEPLAQAAERFNLSVYLRPELEGLDFPTLMQRKLPDLDRAIQAADERAGREFAARRKAAPSVQTGSPAAAVGAASPPAGPRAASAPPANQILSFPTPANTPVDLFRNALQSASPLEPVPPPPAGPRAETEAPEADRLARLQLTVEFAFAVARADGRVARKERAVIDEYLQRHWENEPALRNRLKAFCAQYESGLLDLDACLWQIAARFSPEERGELVTFAGAIADASGERNQREQGLLERIARKLRVALPAGPADRPQAVPEAAAPPSDTRPPAALTSEERLALLEIDLSTPLSADLLRRQYHLLMERYAAEKVAALGPEFVAMADSKRTAIRAAASGLLETLGEPLETTPPATAPPELRHNPDLDAMFGA
jgi:uncharacterized tellurite resistance protein B-like protein